jgi:hypothetical protein
MVCGLGSSCTSLLLRKDLCGVVVQLLHRQVRALGGGQPLLLDSCCCSLCR